MTEASRRERGKERDGGKREREREREREGKREGKREGEREREGGGGERGFYTYMYSTYIPA